MNEEFRELQARYDRLKLLHDTGRAIHAQLESKGALETVLSQAMRACGASGGAVLLLNPTHDRLETEAAVNLLPEARDRKLRVGEGIEGWVVRTGKPHRAGDVSQAPNHVPLRSGVCSLLAVPLEVNGEVRGVLSVDSDRMDAFSADHTDLLLELARQGSEAIQQTWVYEQFRLKAQLFESLVKVSRTINSTQNLEETLQVVVREARELMHAKMASLMMVDGSGEWLDLHASSGAGDAYLNKPRLSISESLVGGVIRRRRPLQEENVQISSRYQNVEVAQAEGLVSLLSVPLLFGDRAIGTLSVYTAQFYTFSNEEIRILSALAELSAIAIEKARLHDRMVEAENQLHQKEKLTALGWLAAEVAHEIRNPLTVMKMLYHSLDLKFPEGDPRVKDARIISEKIDHLNRFVERILDFARTSEPEFASVNLNGLVDELALLVRHRLLQQQIKLDRQLDPALPMIRGDSRQLEQAFLNLILNAADAMPKGGCLKVETRGLQTPVSSDGSQCAEVEFSDTGPGMPAPQRNLGFESVLRSTKPRGTGLGLAIVRRIVESHRGTVSIRSEAGKGTSVTVRLPLA